MNLDIHSTVITAFFLSSIGAFICIIIGVRSIQSGRKLLFFRKRREIILQGWRLLFFSLLLIGLSFFLYTSAEPTIYRFFSPSPTITLTSTGTLIPSITITETTSVTPSITLTPEITNTPVIPEIIATQFVATITPNPAAAFSELQFSTKIDKEHKPVNPGNEFKNPIGTIYGSFTYDKMEPGSQWSALWYQVKNWELVCYESIPWNGGTGGLGYTECKPASNDWIPGEYEVQIFVGMVWKRSGRFTITGEPPTATESPTITDTATSTRTKVPTKTNTATRTPSQIPTQTITWTPSATPLPTFTKTPRPTNTNTLLPTPSSTPTVTKTLVPTSTMIPSRTPRITDTKWPSATP